MESWTEMAQSRSAPPRQVQAAVTWSAMGMLASVNHRPSWNKNRVTSAVVFTSAPVKVAGGRKRTLEIGEAKSLEAPAPSGASAPERRTGGMIDVLSETRCNATGVKRDFSRTRGEANNYKSGTGSGIKNYRKQPTNGLRTEFGMTGSNSCPVDPYSETTRRSVRRSSVDTTENTRETDGSSWRITTRLCTNTKREIQTRK